MDRKAERQLAVALDQCIDRVILGGEAVEDCLSGLPEQDAKALEGSLHAAVQVADSFAFTPRAAAVERGRQRVQDELRRLRAQEPTPAATREGLFRALFRLSPQWAALVLALFVALGGAAGAVAAASGALPGQALYPLKRAIEDAQLALSFSPEAKGEWRLALAERRAGEIVQLVESGAPSSLAAAHDAVRRHLAEVATWSSSGGAEKAGRLTASFSARVLDAFQAAWLSSPAAMRPATGSSFRAAAEAYGRAIESLAALAPPWDEPPAAAGFVDIGATGSATANQAFRVALGEIAVFRPTGNTGEWVTIASEAPTLRLAPASDLQALGRREIAAGWYTRLRLTASGATAVTGGEEVGIGTGPFSLDFVRPFQVVAGRTTAVVLDFAAADSATILADVRGIAGTAVVIVYGPEPGGPPVPAVGRDPGVQRPDVQNEAVPPASAPVHVSGMLTAIAERQWIVAGRTIVLTSSTTVEGVPAVGVEVAIDGTDYTGGSVLARRVTVVVGPPPASRTAPPSPVLPADPAPVGGESTGESAQEAIAPVEGALDAGHGGTGQPPDGLPQPAPQLTPLPTVALPAVLPIASPPAGSTTVISTGIGTALPSQTAIVVPMPPASADETPAAATSIIGTAVPTLPGVPSGAVATPVVPAIATPAIIPTLSAVPSPPLPAATAPAPVIAPSPTALPGSALPPIPAPLPTPLPAAVPPPPALPTPPLPPPAPLAPTVIPGVLPR